MVDGAPPGAAAARRPPERCGCRELAPKLQLCCDGKLGHHGAAVALTVGRLCQDPRRAPQRRLLPVGVALREAPRERLCRWGHLHLGPQRGAPPHSGQGPRWPCMVATAHEGPAVPLAGVRGGGQLTQALGLRRGGLWRQAGSPHVGFAGAKENLCHQGHADLQHPLHPAEPHGCYRGIRTQPKTYQEGSPVEAAPHAQATPLLEA
mmetsp:Transcript_41335/g.98024  ORF Transcript_41335/g.98024 Transcript_41335/m.98024 type:complete len:206 (-) Transcript_41335:278-895(-)